MSDYMFMLESHLSASQSRVVTEVQKAAAGLDFTVFLTGGAMRDMLGGFPVRDLDFTVDGSALKMVKPLTQEAGAHLLETDEIRKSVELVFPGGVTASVSMSRQERYRKPAGKPHIVPATIHEDLRCRDFTINSIALSLNRASRGLLLDPNNGLADLERHELRAVTNYTLYDDPARLLRLERFRVRLGFTVNERTQQQYENVRQAGMETKIPAPALLRELRHFALEPNPGELLKALEEAKLLALFSPELAGPKLNLSGFARLQKAKQLIPFGADFPVNDLGLFLFFLTEKLAPKERTAFVTSIGMTRADLDSWQRLESKVKTVERELKSARLQKPSMVYGAASKAPGEVLLFLFLRSAQRLVQDRIRNYLQKYLLAAQEITDADVAAAGVALASAKFQKKKQELIAARLDARAKKPAPAPEEAPAPPGRK